MTHLSRVASSACAVLILSLQVHSAFGDSPSSDARSIERGRYLIKITGCNDCHTPGYSETGGKVPEKQWLTGSPLGWRGPWGTTYPANLRLAMQKHTEEEWVKLVRIVEFRPPMPWFALRDMSESDLQSIYRYIKHLGPAGEPSPAYVPPDLEPAGPVVRFPAPPK
jgi:mono/diheme cytochrome c family protein